MRKNITLLITLLCCVMWVQDVWGATVKKNGNKVTISNVSAGELVDLSLQDYKDATELVIETKTTGGNGYINSNDISVIANIFKSSSDYRFEKLDISKAATKRTQVGIWISSYDLELSGAFKDCTKLREIILNKNCSKIADHVFDGCIALRSVTNTGGLNEIGEYAFNGCSKLAGTMSIGAVPILGTATVKQYAFLDCKSLTGFTTTAWLSFSLGEGAFSNSGLTSFTIPACCNTIPAYAFKGTDQLAELTFATATLLTCTINNDAFMDSNRNMIVNINGRKLDVGNNDEWVDAFAPEPIDPYLTTLTVPFDDIVGALASDIAASLAQKEATNVAKFFARKFSEYPALEELNLSNWLFIPENALNIEKCSKAKRLKSVVLSENLLYIHKNAFKGAELLSQIKIGKGENVNDYDGTNVLPILLGVNTFLSSSDLLGLFGEWAKIIETALKFVGINDLSLLISDQAIGESAFEGTALENITLPLLCNELGDRAFANTPLTDVVVNGAPSHKVNGQRNAAGETAVFADCSKTINFKMTLTSMLYGVNVGQVVNAQTLTTLLAQLGIDLSGIPLLGNGINDLLTAVLAKVDGTGAGKASQLFFAEVPNQGTLDMSEWFFIPSGTFKGVTDLQARLDNMGADGQKVILPKYILSIGNEAFMESNLTHFTLPIELGAVQSLAEVAGSSVNGLLEVLIGSGSPLYIPISGIVNALLANGNVNAILPTIGSSAFEGTNLGGITLPLFCNMLGDRAFANTSLTEVNVNGAPIHKAAREINLQVFANSKNAINYNLTASSMLYGINLTSLVDAQALIALIDGLGLSLNDSQKDFATNLIQALTPALQGAGAGKAVQTFFTEIPNDKQGTLSLKEWLFIPSYTFENVANLQQLITKQKLMMPMLTLSIGEAAFKNSDIATYNFPLELGAGQLLAGTVGKTTVNELLKLIGNSNLLPSNVNTALSTLLGSLDINKVFPPIGKEAFAETKLTDIHLPLFVNYIGDKAFANSTLKNVCVEGCAVPMTTSFEGCRLENYKFAVSSLLYSIQLNEMLHELGKLGSGVQLPGLNTQALTNLAQLAGINLGTNNNASVAINQLSGIFQAVMAKLSTIEIETPTIHSMVGSAYAAVNEGTHFDFKEWFFIPQESFMDIDFTNKGGMPEFSFYCISVGDRAFKNTQGYHSFTTPLLCVRVGEDAFVCDREGLEPALQELRVQGPLHLVGANAFGKGVEKVQLRGSMLAFDLNSYKEFTEWLLSLTNVGQEIQKAASDALSKLNSLSTNIPGIGNLDLSDFIADFASFGVNTTASRLFDESNTAFGGADNLRPSVNLFEWVHVPSYAFKNCYVPEIKLSPLCIRVGKSAFDSHVEKFTITSPLTAFFGEGAFSATTIVKFSPLVSVYPNLVTKAMYAAVPNATVDITEWMIVPFNAFKQVSNIHYVGAMPQNPVVGEQGAVWLRNGHLIVGNSAFEGCTGLEALDLPDFTLLEKESFASTGLKQILVGPWEFYADDAFANNPALETAIFEATVENPEPVTVLPSLKAEAEKYIEKINADLQAHIGDKSAELINQLIAALNLPDNVAGKALEFLIKQGLNAGVGALNKEVDKGFDQLLTHVDHEWPEVKRSTNGITSTTFSKIPSLSIADLGLWENVPDKAMKAIPTLKTVSQMPKVYPTYSIGTDAFNACVALSKIETEDNILTGCVAAKDQAFAGTTALTTLSIPGGSSLGNKLLDQSGVEVLYLIEKEEDAVACQDETFTGATQLYRVYAMAPMTFVPGVSTHFEPQTRIIAPQGSHFTDAMISNVILDQEATTLARVAVSEKQKEQSILYHSHDFAGGMDHIYLPMGDLGKTTFDNEEALFVLHDDQSLTLSTEVTEDKMWKLYLAANVTAEVNDQTKGNLSVGYEANPAYMVGDDVTFRFPIGHELYWEAQPNGFNAATVYVNDEEVPNPSSMEIEEATTVRAEYRATATTVKLSGQILRLDKPVIGADVILCDMRGNVLAKMSSTEKGYEFHPSIGATYILKATKMGYSGKWEEVVTVTDNEDIVLDLIYTGGTTIPSGIDDVEDGAVRITTANKIIHVAAARAIDHVVVIDFSGKKQKIAAGMTTVAEVRVANSGIYMLKITYADGTSETEKVVVQ